MKIIDKIIELLFTITFASCFGLLIFAMFTGSIPLVVISMALMLLTIIIDWSVTE